MLETIKSEQNIGQKTCAEEQGEEMDKKVGGAKQKDDSTSSAAGRSNNDDTILVAIAVAAFHTNFIMVITHLNLFSPKKKIYYIIITFHISFAKKSLSLESSFLKKLDLVQLCETQKISLNNPLFKIYHMLGLSGTLSYAVYVYLCIKFFLYVYLCTFDTWEYDF